MEEGVSGGGSTSGGSDSSVVSKEEQLVDHHHHVEGCDESDLDLGLGLSLAFLGSKHPLKLTTHNDNNNKNVEFPKIFTAKDLPSLGFTLNPLVVSPTPSASSYSSLALKTSNNYNNNKSANVDNDSDSSINNKKENSGVGRHVSAGTKRAASPTGASQVVGWPPIRAYRMNNKANQAKSIATAEHSSQFDDSEQKDVSYRTDVKAHTTTKTRLPLKSFLFVKVNMDGVAIGRKVDINSHSGYESLASALEQMFINRAAEHTSENELMLMPKVTWPSKLLDGSSDYVLTYEDKDGDWMLVGDVPWGMFIISVKRLRIMRTSEAKGLAPRSEQRTTIKQGSRPI